MTVTVTTRQTQLSPLTHAQLDANFTNLKDAVDDLQAGAAALTASQVINAPAGNIAATDVQGALNELDTEKAKLNGGNSLSGDQMLQTTSKLAFGTGTGSTAGLRFVPGTGGGAATGYGWIYPENVTPGATNYGIGMRYTGQQTLINAASGGTVDLNIADTLVARVNAAGLAVTGSLSTTGNATIGNASSNVAVYANGPASGTNGGGALIAQNGGSSIIGIGNKSVLSGGAYDATPYIWANADISTNRGINVGGILKINPGVTGSKFLTVGGTPGDNASAIIDYIGSNTTTNWRTGTNISASGAFEIKPSIAGGGSTFGASLITLTSSGNMWLGGTADDGTGAKFQVTGSINSSAQIKPGSFTVATLPAALGNGSMAYASNGRKTGEGSGSGTGVMVYYSNSQWRRFYDDAVVTS